MPFEPRSVFATLPRTQRGVPIVINAKSDGSKFLYTNGNSIIIRDVANPEIVDIYTEHACQTTVATYSPSGFYIASGDIQGHVRIWDTVNKEHILKNEFTPFMGVVKDIAYSADNTKICAVGAGKGNKDGHVFDAETGTSRGEIMGQHKALNSVAYSPTRPFRIATASEDNSIAFFEGPPFKFKTTLRDHERFVNCVRYAPDGSIFASGSADCQSFLYNGKDAELLGKLGAEDEKAHKMGIYAISFSPDSKQLLTVSGDKTAKIWDIESRNCVTEFTMGTELDDMQVGCLWTSQNAILTVSLSGYINYLDPNDPSKPTRIIKGHNKPITALAINDEESFYTADSSFRICKWDSNKGNCDVLSAKVHSNQVNDAVICEGQLVTIGVDDTLVFTSTADNNVVGSVKMPSQPRSVSATPGGLVLVACYNEIVLVRNRNIVFSVKVDYEPLSAAIHPGNSECAIGGSRDNMLHIFSINADTLQETATKQQAGMITEVAYSPDGAMIATSDSSRKIYLYSLPEYNVLVSSDWVYHTAKVNTLDWTPDSGHIGSGALDTCVYVWDPNNKKKFIKIQAAHTQSQVTKVRWLDNNTLVSVGQDSNVKLWSMKYE